MKNKRKIVTIAVTVAAVVFLVGVTAIAAGLGSKSDPLVTLSYINDTVKADVEDYADDAVKDLEDDLTSAFDEKLDDFSDDLNIKLDDATVAGESDVFVEVNLSDGEIVNCGIGAEIMLRKGSAEANGVLTDITSGTSANGDLEKDHMYVAIRNGDIRVTSNDTMLLIKGEYTVA